MEISLHEITLENFNECVNLKVSESQTKFVASNVYSIAQSKIYPTVDPLAVYSGDEMVGFVMFGFDIKEDRFFLVRLMIDEKQQGKGFGKGATLEVIKRLKQNEDCKEIYLSFVPENAKAEKLYKSVGFERTGEVSEGEIVMRFTIENN